MDSELVFNVQDTKELQYFQKIQVQKLEIRNLKIKVGQLQSEIDHLNHLLKRLLNRQLILKNGKESMMI